MLVTAIGYVLSDIKDALCMLVTAIWSMIERTYISDNRISQLYIIRSSYLIGAILWLPTLL